MGGITSEDTAVSRAILVDQAGELLTITGKKLTGFGIPKEHPVIREPGNISRCNPGLKFFA